MTTIAFDGKTLAADRQSSLFRFAIRKIWRLRDGRLFGSSGLAEDNVAVARWMDNGGEKPKVADTFHGIIVTAPFHFYGLESKLEPIYYDGQTFAVGSGRDFAMAAMYLGKSAIEAVEVASHFDIDTGQNVEYLLAP